MKQLALGFGAGVVGGYFAVAWLTKMWSRRYSEQWHFQIKAGKTSDSQVPVVE